MRTIGLNLNVKSAARVFLCLFLGDVRRGFMFAHERPPNMPAARCKALAPMLVDGDRKLTQIGRSCGGREKMRNEDRNELRAAEAAGAIIICALRPKIAVRRWQQRADHRLWLRRPQKPLQFQ